MTTPLFDDITQNYHGGNPESAAARQSIQPVLKHMCLKVYNAVAACGDKGATVDELEVALGGRHQSVSARVTELKALGLLVKTDGHRRTRSGRYAAVVVAKIYWSKNRA